VFAAVIFCKRLSGEAWRWTAFAGRADSNGEDAMRRFSTLMLFAVIAGPTVADDPPECKRFVERAGAVCYPHTRERSGIDNCIKRAEPSVTHRNLLGYVNCATFGMDNSLFGRRPGRVFPGLWPEGRTPTSFSARYATEGTVKVPDVVAAQPVRKAIIESRRPPEGEHDSHHEKHEKHDEHKDHKDHKHDKHHPEAHEPGDSKGGAQPDSKSHKE
jgi:hypothetical protein